jgi:hypothetical protein
MIVQEKEMKISQTYRADSASQDPKSALRGMMQRLGLTLLACTLAIGATASASARQAVNAPRKRPLQSPELLEKSNHLQAAHSTFRHPQA